MVLELTQLYKELEGIDLNILLCAGDHQLAKLTPYLKNREAKIRGIGCLLAELSLSQLNQHENSTLIKMQEQAMNRGQRIKFVLNQMYLAAKQDSLKCNSGRAINTPYLRKKSVDQRRVKL